MSEWPPDAGTAAQYEEELTGYAGAPKPHSRYPKVPDEALLYLNQPTATGGAGGSRQVTSRHGRHTSSMTSRRTSVGTPEELTFVGKPHAHLCRL